MVRRGTEAPRIIGGGARYNVIDRPRRKSTIQWAGDDPLRMDLPILIDGWMDRRNIEPDIAMVNQLVHSKSDLIPPTEIYIDGAMPVQGARWVVESIDWGNMVIWTGGHLQTGSVHRGHRLRQDATLRLLQSIPPEVLRLNRSPSAHLPYVVKIGDTADSIAKKHGVTSKDIKKANPPMRDAKEISRSVGKQIKVPQKSPLRDYPR